MLRLSEILLLVAPFAAVIAWRVFLPHVPTRRLLIAFAALVAVLGGSLVWMSQDDTLTPNQAYVPAHAEDGVIVPARGVPR
jgi:NhaP-type Na+/H+ or K+/H+ antiporter